MLVDLLLIALGAFVASILGRYLIAYLNTDGDDRFQEAGNRTARWLGMIFGGLVVAGSVGLIQFGDILGQIFAFIGGHPFVTSNLAAIGLGAGGISGLLNLTASQYVGIGLAIAGLVFIFSEVENAT